MLPFVRFGRAGIDVTEIFSWYEDPETQSVQVFSKHSADMTLVPPEYHRFMQFMQARSIDSEAAVALFGAARPAEPDEVRRTSP